LTRTRRFQKQIKVNVWAAVIDEKLIGPYFLPSRLNSEYYREFLDVNLHEFFESVALNDRATTYFQQDVCSTRSANIVTAFLNEKFPGRWLGRYGPIKWSPRSPDLTPFDFFLWETVKQLVYDGRASVNSVKELMERIEVAFEVIRSQNGIIRNAIRSILHRAQACIGQRGNQFEHLL
jgi:hypothetical protein